MSAPIAAATLQAALLGAISNILAQAITAYRKDLPLEVDWIPVFQFTLFNLINTPPNVLWQEFLESTFPAYVSPPKFAQPSVKIGAAAPPPQFSVRNTMSKFFIDQTLGAIYNTLAFSLYVHALKAAMLGAPRITHLNKAISYWTSPNTINLNRVDPRAVWDAALEDFWPLASAGWKLWPAVSLVNFSLVKTVQTRALIGSVAGLVWGVYMSLVAAN
ncbi:hypothetical protein S7711_00638 [Stachybotrys chartarum IBT 7711]|uniref:Uncharacterized protein n=1 Tax=Stachybotrys chartarum (strain CBS 109288 / IBT 7711) TaxID=1280523 RepID=A0A084ATY9_STACB|nr:hypothetical protein S7711_00638 [Stachybotrys chartarum IBT 7711]KFA48649.1 hypothetical protein S40293_04557 [Stachybotrys chartarum IBT 40293]KFA77558.1 hypothetical protein S40288_05761 [Stachybotrys chartarum IBT 40288]